MPLNRKRYTIRRMKVILVSLLLLIVSGEAAGQSLPPAKVRVNGVELSYIEAGQGDPLILLHGGASDYRAWAPQWDALARKFHLISYSRRYNYPNRNALTVQNHSASIEAEDLVALIRKLKLGRVHLVGHSYGAFTALALALEHPEMVRSLVLAEPPVHQWIRGLPDGEPAYQEFIANIWEPVGDAFKNGSEQQAMKLFVDGLGPGRFDNLAPEARAILMQNVAPIQALALSSDPFPNLSKDKARKLNIPVLIVTGANTIKIHRMVNEELVRVIPGAEKAMILNAGHASPRENPQAFNEALLKFFAAHAVNTENRERSSKSARRSGTGAHHPENHGGA